MASRSPQRRAILEQLGVEFSVVEPDVEELSEGPPVEVAAENAYRKAARVAADHPQAPVLGADTVVSLGPKIYGKCADATAAEKTLHALSGRRHVVYSGLCLIEGGRARTVPAATTVEFRSIDDRLMEWYLGSGEWRDRAGAYAVQGRGAALVARVEGDYLGVVGLPVSTLLELWPQLLFGD